MAMSRYLIRAGLLGALMMVVTLVITSGPLAAQTQASFSAPQNFGVGDNRPRSVTTADFNGDTFTDIATANYLSGSVEYH